MAVTERSVLLLYAPAVATRSRISVFSDWVTLEIRSLSYTTSDILMMCIGRVGAAPNTDYEACLNCCTSTSTCSADPAVAGPEPGTYAHQCCEVPTCELWVWKSETLTLSSSTPALPLTGTLASAPAGLTQALGPALDPGANTVSCPV